MTKNDTDLIFTPLIKELHLVHIPTADIMTWPQESALLISVCFKF